MIIKIENDIPIEKQCQNLGVEVFHIPEIDEIKNIERIMTLMLLFSQMV